MVRTSGTPSSALPEQATVEPEPVERIARPTSVTHPGGEVDAARRRARGPRRRRSGSRRRACPRTAGRPRSTRIATSRPARSDAIIPVAAQPKTSRLTRPKAVAGDASSSICRVTSAPPLSESGSASTISLITSLRRSSLRSTIPKIATSTIESGTSEKRTR